MLTVNMWGEEMTEMAEMRRSGLAVTGCGAAVGVKSLLHPSQRRCRARYRIAIDNSINRYAPAMINTRLRRNG